MPSRKNNNLFAEVLLPLPLSKYFTYTIPAHLHDKVHIGMRVIVNFGSQKISTGLVADIHGKAPEKHYKLKEILEVLDTLPTVYSIQLKLWQWVADYYLCPIGEVMNAALPSGLKLTSQSKIQFHPEFSVEQARASLTSKELTLLNELKNYGTMTYTKAAEILEIKHIYRVIKSLIDKQAVIVFQELKEKYQPKKLKRLRLHPDFTDEKNLQSLFTALSKQPKQEEVLLKYLANVPVLNDVGKNKDGIAKSIFLQKKTGVVSPSSLQTLIKNGIFEEFETILPRFQEFQQNGSTLIHLSKAQENAYQQIITQFGQKPVVLLHGITGSGKTEIYIKLALQALESSSQVLMLLPEIVLTVQIVLRLKNIFGNTLGIYHSGFSDNERAETWKGVQQGKYNIVIGVRSAVFLPFDNLGLIIIDEEHEHSYKQSEHAPYYHARNLAIMLAHFHQAKTILGSATPSVESYYLARTGYYGLTTLLERYGDAQLPEVILANTKKERLSRRMKNEFSSQIISHLQQVVKEKEQAILFQNRRGYAPYIICEVCGWVSGCDNCNVKLTYHLYRNEMRCHYCGYRKNTPKVCAKCNAPQIKTVGLGTEKLEDELKLLLPEANIRRMDWDTTRKKYSYYQIIKDFENRDIDILVGTQMVSKGLDFDRVSLVGVFDTDRLIHFPDFRAHERAFQLVTQVSGRAGRRAKPGKVIIQTNNPQQLLLRLIARHDYMSFYEREIHERKQYAYPPFTRLIRLTVKTTDNMLRDDICNKLTKYLVEHLGVKRILGPQYPIVDKIRNEYLKEVLIKLERNKTDLPKTKAIIYQTIKSVQSIKNYRRAKVVVDVDPV